jgi:hypothetical protein
MFKFSSSVIKELKYYVYVYSNPLTDEIFYVGKGKGNRVFSHLTEASESEKVKYLNDLAQQGLKPKIEILSHGLENSEIALKIESSIIDLLGIKNLTNRQKGFKSATFGRMTVNQIKSTYNKQQVEIVEPSILIRINQAFRYSMTPMELYDYTRGQWVLNPDNAKAAKYAFSIYEGIIQEVYEVAGWFKAGTTYSVRESNEHIERDKDERMDNRYEFVGNIALQEVRDKYILKSVEHLFKKGNSNPIMYINL